jgi:PIN domain nuclease of toxin-antitoxin system
LEKPFDDLIPEQLATNSIGLLPVDLTHIAKVVALPFHHRDPFDRLIIAQALVEGIPIVGRDGAFDEYGVQRLW